VRRADLIVVDSIEQARMESGDLVMALEEKDWSSPRHGGIEGCGFAGKAHARTAGSDHLFKSIGLAVEDVIAAGFVYERAQAQGRGSPVPHS
jgi:alanine dehydrogenase